MYIVSKDRKSIINFEQVTAMYIGSDGCSVKVDYSRGSGSQLGRYESDKEARKAIEVIADSIDKTKVCYMPDDQVIKAKINLEEQRHHHITGKKTKGHGGS